MTNTPTNQTPSECKHYIGWQVCLLRNEHVVLGRGQKACCLARGKSHCPDYQPKEKKDGR